MKCKILFFLTVVLISAGCANNKRGQTAVEEVLLATGGNPVIKEGSADPSVRVFNGRVFIYPSHDFSPDNEFWIMKDWKVYSSADLINFTDHGIALAGTDIKWANDPDHCWAPDCMEKNGKYYFYYPLSDIRGIWKGMIGVGVSDTPYGPFVDPLGHPLVEDDARPEAFEEAIYNIDPAVFTDEDGRSYLFWGNGACLAAELNDDMISFNSAIQEVKIDNNTGYREGPFVWKRNGIYYMLYSRVGGESYDVLDYATAENVLGPYRFRGTIIGHGMKGNEHGSVFEYRGQWYVAYHDLFPTDKYRKTCIDIIHYRENGEIVRTCPTRKGVGWYDAGEIIEAENYFAKSEGPQYVEHIDTGFYMHRVGEGDWLFYPNIKMPFDFSGNFQARVAYQGEGGTIEILADSLDGTLIGEVDATSGACRGEWYTINTVLEPVSGTMNIYLRFRGGKVDLDWIGFDQAGVIR